MARGHVSRSLSPLGCMLLFVISKTLLFIMSVSAASQQQQQKNTDLDYFRSKSGVKVRKQGWNPSDETSAIVRGNGRCNIDRRPTLIHAEFVRDYLGKKPVVLGSPTHFSMNITFADLETYIYEVGDIPWAVFTPVGRPSVGGRMLKLAEYMATFSTQSERDAWMKKSSASLHKNGLSSTTTSSSRIVMGSTASASFHCSPISVSTHSELATQLIRHRHRNHLHQGTVGNNTITTISTLDAHADSSITTLTNTPSSKKNTTSTTTTTSSSSSSTPEKISDLGKGNSHPALCMAHFTPSTIAAASTSITPETPCDCPATFMVIGESGAGLPFHWHAQVPGNEIVWGQKRWFLSRHVPPGGFNHRRTQYEWVRDVYPTLPPAVFGEDMESFRASPTSSSSSSLSSGKSSSSTSGAAAGVEPALYECLLSPGEVMYAPDAWYHATLDVGHAISVVYDTCNITAAQRNHARTMSALMKFHSISPDSMPWAPFNLMENDNVEEAAKIAAQVAAASRTTASSSVEDKSSSSAFASSSSSHSSDINLALLTIVDYPNPAGSTQTYIDTLRAIHYTIKDPLAERLLSGPPESPIPEYLHVALSGAGKAAHAAEITPPLNGLSLSVRSLTPRMDTQELLIAHHAAALWPAEPEFLLATARGSLRLARDFVREELKQKDRKTESEKEEEEAGSEEKEEELKKESDDAQASTTIQKAIAEMDPATGLARNYATFMVAQSLPRLAYLLRVNPLLPDAYALLSFSVELRAGVAGWPVNVTRRRTPAEEEAAVLVSGKNDNDNDDDDNGVSSKGGRGRGGKTAKTNEKKKNDLVTEVSTYSHNYVGYHMLDVALAAARRALALDPLSGATCNQIASLLSKGAVDRLVYDAGGQLRYRKIAHEAVGIAIPEQEEQQVIAPAEDDDEQLEEREEFHHHQQQQQQQRAPTTRIVVRVPTYAPDGILRMDAVVDHVVYYEEYHQAWWKAIRGRSLLDPIRADRVSTQLLRCISIATAGLSVASSEDGIRSFQDDFTEATDAWNAVLKAKKELKGEKGSNKKKSADAADFFKYVSPHEAQRERESILKALERLASKPIASTTSTTAKDGKKKDNYKNKQQEQEPLLLELQHEYTAFDARREIQDEEADDILPLYITPMRKSGLSTFETAFSKILGPESTEDVKTEINSQNKNNSKSNTKFNTSATQNETVAKEGGGEEEDDETKEHTKKMRTLLKADPEISFMDAYEIVSFAYRKENKL